MSKRKIKKNPYQLELNFELSSGAIKTKGTELEFDFFNKERNFFGQMYKNKTKLHVDILRLTLADKASNSRKPVQRMILFRSELTRKRVATANRLIFKRHRIETAILR